MKKTLLILGIALISLTSCEKEEVIDNSIKCGTVVGTDMTGADIPFLIIEDDEGLKVKRIFLVYKSDWEKIGLEEEKGWEHKIHGETVCFNGQWDDIYNN